MNKLTLPERKLLIAIYAKEDYSAHKKHYTFTCHVCNKSHKFLGLLSDFLHHMRQIKMQNNRQ